MSPHRGPSPNNVIDRFDTTVTVYGHLPDESVGDSHYVDDGFGAPTDLTVSIRPDTADAFGVRDLGQTTDGGERLICMVPTENADQIDIDASIDYDGQAWRVTKRQVASRNDFERYLLLPDTRRTVGNRT